jgi:hypothetical protein
MTRTEMVCTKCVKFDGEQCRLNPVPVDIINPVGHWCSQGQWNEWSERYREMEPFYWGEWDENLDVHAAD